MEEINDSDYTPMKLNFYNYEEVNKFDKNIDDYLYETKTQNVHFCIYQVDNNHKYPFLKYLLYKNEYSDTLELPYMALHNNMTSENIISFSSLYLFSLFSQNNYDLFSNLIEFKGFYVYNNEVYMFYDLTKYNLKLDNITRKDPLWFCLLNEILNGSKVCNFMIDKKIVDFFIDNFPLCLLKNENNESYELPIVGYVGKNNTLLNFTYIFGETVKDKNAILGPYYYFTDFKNSIRDGAWTIDNKPETKYDILLTDNENGRYIKGGIVRFALFMDNSKYIENYPNDDIDKSDVKRERLENPLLDQQIERLTMRISDHDGIWGEKYDSVYLGAIELDNGEKLKNTPLFVIKNYDQQIPLSYHYIDKSSLTDKFDMNKEYLIE